MGIHDSYGKTLLAKAFGERYDRHLASSYSFGDGAGEARLDGTIDGDIAVEIESRTDKQVRGALIDLALHPFKRKLLVIVPAHMHSVEQTRRQCTEILDRLGVIHEVVALMGTGSSPRHDEDIKALQTAVAALRQQAVPADD